MQDRYAVVVSMGFLMPVLASCAILARLKSRKIRKVDMGFDDYFSVGALVRKFSYLLLAEDWKLTIIHAFLIASSANYLYGPLET